MNAKYQTMLWLALDTRTPEGEAVAALMALRRAKLSYDEVMGKPVIFNRPAPTYRYSQPQPRPQPRSHSRRQQQNQTERERYV